MGSYRFLAPFMSRKISQLIHSIRKTSQPLQRTKFCRAWNSASAGIKRIIFVSPNFEKIAKDKYDSVGRGCLLDVLHFFEGKTI